MALSPNGYIARPGGAEDWLSAKNWQEMLDVVEQTQNLVIGRNTYEVVKKLYQDHGFDTIDTPYKLIVTRNPDYRAPQGFSVVHSPQQAIDFLSSQGVDTMLLTGGSKLNAEFLKAGLVNEIVLILEPHIIGQGIPLIAPDDYELSLVLKAVDKLEDGRVKLSYEVNKYE